MRYYNFSLLSLSLFFSYPCSPTQLHVSSIYNRNEPMYIHIVDITHIYFCRFLFYCVEEREKNKNNDDNNKRLKECREVKKCICVCMCKWLRERFLRRMNENSLFTLSHRMNFSENHVATLPLSSALRQKSQRRGNKFDHTYPTDTRDGQRTCEKKLHP